MNKSNEQDSTIALEAGGRTKRRGTRGVLAGMGVLVAASYLRPKGEQQDSYLRRAGTAGMITGGLVAVAGITLAFKGAALQTQANQRKWTQERQKAEEALAIHEGSKRGEAGQPQFVVDGTTEGALAARRYAAEAVLEANTNPSLLTPEQHREVDRIQALSVYATRAAGINL